MAERPICPMCGEYGIHPTVQRCIEELKAKVERLTVQQREPALVYLGRFVPSFWP